ncbi:hypothetical protein MP228_004637 [Amoeboaphelidium protococcarum]|nr:hypothetical protein MP228_004637 [Amoeboaphelidium protococcarum]
MTDQQNKMSQIAGPIIDHHSEEGDLVELGNVKSPRVDGDDAQQLQPPSSQANSHYEVYVNQQEKLAEASVEYKYPTNYIRTTKYTALTFLPINLFNQFRRFYNIYFLFAAVFAFYPNASAISPATQITPLLFILIVTMIKDGIEDYLRYRSDAKANNLPAEVIRNGLRLECLSKDIVPGDIVLVKKNEVFPADLILLSTSFSDGTCFIETAQLDGETNLKRKSALGDLADLVSADHLKDFKCHIECETPNNRMNQFEGRIVVEESGASQKKTYPLSIYQMLLRGAELRNTDFIYGICVYAGVDTKIIKNLQKTSLKFSTMQSKLNLLLIGTFIYNAIILIVSVIYGSLWANQNIDPLKAWYVWNGVDASTTSGLQAMTYYILYTYVIPISLFISMEIVRVFQAYFIIKDEQMTLPVPGQKDPSKLVSVVVKNSNLNEELGSIDYIFSDKTGTLTQNLMKLSQWYVGSQLYDEMHQPGSVLKDYQTRPSDQNMLMFLRLIALCHSAIPTKDEVSGKIIYESESPDETALLESMRDNGVVVLDRSKGGIRISIDGREESYEILEVVEFNSDRKRMSVLLRIDGRVCLLCKGADSVILDRRNRDQSKDYIADVEQKLKSFSLQGLRTLVYAYRFLSEDEYLKFSAQYQEASTQLQNREKSMMQVAELIERNMDVIACSAIEDKLQDNVPETIDFLLQSGIKVWVLTGDKTETAIKIAISCKLFNAETQIHILESKTEDDCRKRLSEALGKITSADGQTIVHGLAINGECLRIALESCPNEFLEVATKCHSVLCTRVSPLQKSLVVKLVRDNMKKITLAVGDGANDVSMIQSAHVGVGIVGMEGAQAVRASDFAIPQFQCLKRLITVHGRYNHYRLSQIIYFSLFKNLGFITVCFWFGIYSGWSGLQIYQETFLSLYNVIFTSLPPIAMATFEKDIGERILNEYPQLYATYRQRPFMSTRRVVEYLILPFWHSVVVMFGLVLALGDGTISPSGLAGSGYWQQAWMASSVIMLIVMLKAFLVTRHIVSPFVASVGVSMLVYIVFMYLAEAIGLPSFPGSANEVNTNIVYYLFLLIIVLTALLPDYLWSFLSTNYFPRDVDILRQEQSMQKAQRRRTKVTPLAEA